MNIIALTMYNISIRMHDEGIIIKMEILIM